MTRQNSFGRRGTIIGGGLLLVGLAAVAVLALKPAEKPGQSQPADPPTNGATLDELRPQVTEFCGACHEVPSAAGFPKAAWRKEVQNGYDFYVDSGRTDLEPPPLGKVVAWFRNQAPVEVVIPPHAEGPISNKLKFRVATSARDGPDQRSGPAVSFVGWRPLSAGAPPVLLSCDMRSGEVRGCEPLSGQLESRLIARLAHPAHAEPCDLDGDGNLDLVVAELGSFQPADHAHGKVVWLRQGANDSWETVVLQEGLGRVTDVEPGDFDGDGDLDLVVAEFGWQKTGRILLLENVGGARHKPEFRLREIDGRHGTIHVPTADLNADGRLDFVALISQEHETVEAFLNDGGGEFRRKRIFSANEPAFGSSGIQLVDLDRDGDLDVVYTNGDTFDSFYLKPYHGIRWLENRGSFPFADHQLAVMPGAHRALACDLDGDGDLDIVACSLLPDRLWGGQSAIDFDALLWLEQTEPGRFVRHSLEKAPCRHAAMDVGDFDGDGDVDLAVGTFAETGELPALSVWWNLRIDAGTRE